MKNKEIEELLNDFSKVYEAHVKIIDKYDNADEIHYASPISLKQIKLLLSYIEQLEKENDRLKKDYAIVINDNCDYITLEKKIEQLENNRDKAIEYIESHFIFNDKTGECYQTHTFDKDNVKKLCDKLKGDSDE